MRRALPIILLLAAGCSDLVAPIRLDTYEYRVFASKGAEGTDTLSFHWPRSFLPVRVWVAANDSLAAHLPTALARWNGVFLYGELQLIQVADSNAADIVVQNTISPGGGGFGFAIGPLESSAPQCSGETDVDTLPGRLVKLPVHTYVWPNSAQGVPNIAACYRITVTHELGHAIGLLVHSPNSADVMYLNPVLDGLSERDRNTAETLYHVAAILTPTGRR